MKRSSFCRTRVNVQIQNKFNQFCFYQRLIFMKSEVTQIEQTFFHHPHSALLFQNQNLALKSSENFSELNRKTLVVYVTCKRDFSHYSAVSLILVPCKVTSKTTSKRGISCKDADISQINPWPSMNVWYKLLFFQYMKKRCMQGSVFYFTYRENKIKGPESCQPEAGRQQHHIPDTPM